jgi:hypothetical protein
MQPHELLKQESIVAWPVILYEIERERMSVFILGPATADWAPLGTQQATAYLGNPANNLFLVQADGPWGEVPFFAIVKESAGIWYAINETRDPEMYRLGRTNAVTNRNLIWLIDQFGKLPCERADHPPLQL